MATQEWQTGTVRLTKPEKDALLSICKRENKAVNAKIREVIQQVIAPIMDPSILPEQVGIPSVGSHHFKYDSESETFLWQLDLGEQGKHVLSRTIQHSFLVNLGQAVDKALETQAGNQVPKGLARIPRDLQKHMEVKR